MAVASPVYEKTRLATPARKKYLAFAAADD